MGYASPSFPLFLPSFPPPCPFDHLSSTCSHFLSFSQMPFSHTNAISDNQQLSSNYLFLFEGRSQPCLVLTHRRESLLGLRLVSLTCWWYSIPMLRVLTRIAIMIPRLKYLLSTILFSFSLKPIHARHTPFLYSLTPRRLRPLPDLSSPA